MESMDINEIKAMLPHRYPFLLVDRIIDLKPEENVVGIKNVTINEEFFQGHFPDHPIMPGVLILESMAQISGLLMYEDVESPQDKVPYFTGIKKARFRRPVTPGDQLRIEGKVIKKRGNIAKVSARSYVDEDLVAEAELTFALQDKEG